MVQVCSLGRQVMRAVLKHRLVRQGTAWLEVTMNVLVTMMMMLMMVTMLMMTLMTLMLNVSPVTPRWAKGPECGCQH